MNKKTTPKKETTKKLTDALKLEIRNEFVQGVNKNGKIVYPTLDELIKKHNVAQSTIYRTARMDSWKLQKDQYISEYQAKLDKQRQKDNAQRSRQMDDQSITLANALFATVGQVIQLNNNELKQGKLGLMPNQINSLANALATAQRTAKLALGEATDNINANISENNDAFRRAMELLDEVETSRSQSIDTTH